MDSHLLDHINILIHLAKVDGDFDIKEKALIYNVCLRKGIPLDDIGDLIDAPKPLPQFLQLDDATACEYMMDCLLVMMVDGKILPTEVRYCLEIGKKLGFDRVEIKSLIEKLQDTDSPSEEILKHYVQQLERHQAT